MAEVEVKGLSELLKTMKALPIEMVSKNGGPLRSALYQAAKLIRDTARRRAPKDTGNLERNLILFRDKNPKATGVTERYGIGVRAFRWTGKRKLKAQHKAGGKIDRRASGDAFYWRFVEFGTEKMKAEPFLRPAFETEKNAALETFKDRLAQGVQKIVKRIGGK